MLGFLEGLRNRDKKVENKAPTKCYSSWLCHTLTSGDPAPAAPPDGTAGFCGVHPMVPGSAQHSKAGVGTSDDTAHLQTVLSVLRCSSPLDLLIDWLKSCFRTRKIKLNSPQAHCRGEPADKRAFGLQTKTHALLLLQACHFPTLFIIPLSHKCMKMKLAAVSPYCISRQRHRGRKVKATSSLMPEAFLPSLDFSWKSTGSHIFAPGKNTFLKAYWLCSHHSVKKGLGL